MTQVLTTGGSRGFVGVAVQPVHLPAAQRTEGRERGLLVVGVTSGGPAEAAGIIVGDLMLDFSGTPVQSAEELLDRLTGIGGPRFTFGHCTAAWSETWTSWSPAGHGADVTRPDTREHGTRAPLAASFILGLCVSFSSDPRHAASGLACSCPTG